MLQTYVDTTSITALFSTGYHSPSKPPPLVIASYTVINSRLLALGNHRLQPQSMHLVPTISAATPAIKSQYPVSLLSTRLHISYHS